MIDKGTGARTAHRRWVRVRLMEEKCAELYSAAKIRGFLHLYVGEEAVARRIAAERWKTTRWWPPTVSMPMRCCAAFR